MPETTRKAEAERDRVRSYGPPARNKSTDEDIRQCLAAHAAADRETIARHIEQLNREWDMERYLQTNASILALSGVLLGFRGNRRWLVLPGIVFSFLLQHGLQGWCPPMPLFRRAGVRTRKEINREKYALKAMAGDFAQLRREVEKDAA